MIWWFVLGYEPVPVAPKNIAQFKSGKKWLKNNRLSLMAFIRDTLCSWILAVKDCQWKTFESLLQSAETLFVCLFQRKRRRKRKFGKILFTCNQTASSNFLLSSFLDPPRKLCNNVLREKSWEEKYFKIESLWMKSYHYEKLRILTVITRLLLSLAV